MTPVSEVWGVGGRTAAKLEALGVRTVLDFVRVPGGVVRRLGGVVRRLGGVVRRLGGVVLERTWLELQGRCCIELEETPPGRKQIVRSRSFSAPVSDFDGLLCAASVRMESAARVLRREGSEATHVGVLFSTSRFRENEPQHSAEVGERLLRPTADTIELTAVAEALVRRAW